jgi:cobalt/nickel transport system ATP-binding protein
LDPLIRVRGLRFAYPDGTEALRGIDFDLMPGENVVLLGANGSGKTSFLLHLNGLLEGEGEIHVCAMPLNADTKNQIRARIGMVFQDADEQLFMSTVLEDVSYGPLQQGKSREEAGRAALAALEQTGMSAAGSRAPYHLSAGEKQRVALAGVLAMQPEILVLDEPTTSLDPPGQRELLRLLQGLPQAKIITTHDTAFAKALASRAVFFEQGLIVDSGSVDELVRRRNWTSSNHTL